MFEQEMTNPYSAASIPEFMTRVFRWMATAVGLSGLIAWYAASSEAFVTFMVANPGVFYGLVIAELALVLFLSLGFNKLSDTGAIIGFILYSVLTGVTISSVFMIYTTASVLQTFLATALMYAALAMYGATTKKDLSGWGTFLIMSLFGLIIASVVNIFMSSHFLTWVTTYAGIIIFAGLTAYDTQKLKVMARFGASEKMAIMGALSLYLDFVNLFLHLLRIMGDRR